jgi:hypothetical protein
MIEKNAFIVQSIRCRQFRCAYLRRARAESRIPDQFPVEAKRQSASRREGTAADGEYLRSDMRQLDEVLFHETDHKLRPDIQYGQSNRVEE